MIPEALRGKRQVGGRLTAYLCRDHACSAPMTSFDEVAKALSERPGTNR
jgi:uncharacterized protein YyaL (SSP411 family)